MKAAKIQAKLPVDPADLLAHARACLDKAYAPYSRFPVAAAVVDDLGRIFTGVNVENASYGLTICAERVAVFAAIASGAQKIVAVAVTSRMATSVPPCGACRQVLSEFSEPDTSIYFDAGNGMVDHWTMAALLPNAFGPSYLNNKR